MVNIIFSDGLHQYASDPEMQFRWDSIGASNRAHFEQLGRSGGRSVAAYSHYARDAFTKILAQPTQRIGVHFRAKCTSPATVGTPLLCMGALATHDVNKTKAANTTSPSDDAALSDIITFSFPAPRVPTIHNVIRTGSGKNALLVGQGNTVINGNQLYSFEILADVSQPQARIVMAMDGVIILDTTFDRDRIAPAAGHVTDVIEYVSFGANSQTANQRMHYSDIVIYEPDEGDLAPIGPLAVDYVPAEGFTLPVSNNSGQIVPVGDSLTRPLLTSDSDIGQVFSARMLSRTVPGIVDRPYNAKIELLDAEGAPVAELATGRVDGATPVIMETPVPGIENIADLAGLQVKVAAL